MKRVADMTVTAEIFCRERCAQCGLVLGAGPTYAFRGGVYHSSCKDLLREVQAETEAALRVPGRFW